MSLRPPFVKTTLAALLALPLLAVPADAVEWLDGNGRSCDLVCGKGGGGRAISSGEHRPGGASTGKRFYVCSANLNGWRSGYNLQPSWSNVCMVGYGGKEVRASPYLCACE